VDANQYAISARGFNNTLANKLLVLIDGRTIYTPLFSGTFWEAHDLMLEDIDRIEVISGPGATLWGANAVNGVINIITRSAAATQGQLSVLRAGAAQDDLASRYGGKLGDDGHYRVYGKTVRRAETTLAGGAPNRDRGEHAQGGFRADWARGRDALTLQGDAYEGSVFEQGREFSGLNVLGRWTRDLGDGAELRAQAFYNRTTRNHFGTFREELDSYDVEAQHGLAPRGAHRLLWGAGMRQHDDRVQNSPLIQFLPEDRRLSRHHVFAQDEIALRRDLDLTLGAKVEYNSYTGNEFLPSARIGWKLSEAGLLWAAASRAVRAPSRVDRDLFAPLVPVPLAGGPEFTSEVAKVAELGYRGQPTRRVSYAVTGFYARYENLRTLAPSPAGVVVANNLEGDNLGVEGWATWRAADAVRLNAGFVRQELELKERPGTVNLAPGSEGNDPKYWLKLRAAIDLTPQHELDLVARHYARRPNPEVPAYTALDVRLAWRAAKDMELALLAQNLLDRRHPEWGAAASRAEMERAFYVSLRLGI
jgi:iron complex outermembrane receptor protein